MFDLSAIEQAIKDSIVALKRPYIAEVKTYGGEFDDDLGLDQVIKRFPAVWVTFSGAGVPTRKGAKRWHVPLTFTVLMGARSIRSEESARHGVMINGQLIDAGSFQLLRDVVKALAGKSFELKIDPMSPGRITTIFNTKTRNESVSVLAMDWLTYAYITVSDDDAECADWLDGVNLNYVLKPHVEAEVFDTMELSN